MLPFKKWQPFLKFSFLKWKFEVNTGSHFEFELKGLVQQN